jgi:hypothetical protein
MTKIVRSEDAALSNYKVVSVQVWDKGCPGGKPDKMAFEKVFDHPTQMTGGDVYLTSTRYIVIRKASA